MKYNVIINYGPDYSELDLYTALKTAIKELNDGMKAHVQRDDGAMLVCHAGALNKVKRDGFTLKEIVDQFCTWE